MQINDVIGKRFGKLTVTTRASRKGYVVCACDCGTVKEIRATSLTKAYQPTRSCGCNQREVAKSIGSKTIANNSKQQIETNFRHNTNFQVIEKTTPPKNNRSGHKGVWWDNRRGMYQAYIQVHGKRIHLGRYYTYEDAVKARERAEEEYFAPLINEKQEVVE